MAQPLKRLEVLATEITSSHRPSNAERTFLRVAIPEAYGLEKVQIVICLCPLVHPSVISSVCILYKYACDYACIFWV